MKSKLSLAMSRSDRTNPILTRQAVLPGFEFDVKSTMVEEIFLKQANEVCYDIAEMSLASYLIGLDRGETRLTAIPVFLSRAFRHNALYVREDSPFTHPEQLRHKRIGLPEYQMTAAVWIRAYFRHEWNVPAEEINWVTFRPERIPIATPAERADSDDLFEALVSGEVDAIMSARRPPSNYFPASGKGGAIRRLIPDVWQEERNYFKRTGMFPIMHLVSIKKETAEKYPELPNEVFQFMQKVKQESLNRVLETVQNSVSVPWMWEAAEASAEIIGEDVWPYGLKQNWEQIEAFIKYLQEDGLITRSFTPDQVFAPGVLNT